MPELSSNGLTSLVRQAAHPLTGASDDYDLLLELVGDARYVLLGEASHGTHEFYRERAQRRIDRLRRGAWRRYPVDSARAAPPWYHG
jgi:erythromycin esterase-like protein